MQVAFDPNNGDTLASASLDKTARIWNVDGTQKPKVLIGHEKGLNGICWITGQKILTCSDDFTVKVWDLADKKPSCVATLEKHTGNVSRGKKINYFLR